MDSCSELRKKNAELESMVDKLSNEISRVRDIDEFRFSDCGVINYGRVYDALRRAYGEEADVNISDTSFYLIDDDEMIKFLKLDPTDTFKYVPDKQSEGTVEVQVRRTSELANRPSKFDFDCDNFAFRLMGQMNHPNRARHIFGFAWAGNPCHASNWYINQDKQVISVEPQNDRVILLVDAGDMYLPGYLVVA